VANKKILILTYYWPPSGGTGVQRWLHFTRYLKELGWDPIIFTPSNPEAPVQDSKLLAQIPEGIEVLKLPIWEPTQLYMRLNGNKGKQLQTGFMQENKKKPGLLQRFALFVRANIFIPDAKMAWVKPASRYLIDYLKTNEVAALISTGPPHTMHLIARNVKRATKLPWLADFRDPWTQIDWFEQLPLNRFGLAKHQALEKSVLLEADQLTIVSSNWQQQTQALCGRDVALVTNGYAPEDFAAFQQQPDPYFTILHTGSINKDRNPSALWKSLGRFTQNNPEFATKLRIRLIGALDASVRTDIEEAGLMPYTYLENFVPHARVIEELSACSLLLLPINNVKNQMGIIPGKVFEYLASEQPILAIGPIEGDSATILRKQAGTHIVGFQDSIDWTTIIEMCAHKPNRKASLTPYSREELSNKIHDLLLELVKK
jgi:glycosyltransferase involved in cell wall biosynthesis